MMVGRGAKKQGHPLLRPLQPRLGDPRDRRPAAAGLPDALVQQRRLQALRPDRPALPARLHRQVLGALRRQGQRRGAPRDRRRLLRLHGRPDRRRSSSASRRRCTPPPRRSDFEKAARLRDDLGALEQALEKQAVVLGDGTDADVIALRRGPARGRGPDLLRARRPDPRPARLGRRPGRGGRHRRAGRATSCSSCTPASDGDAIPREILVPALPPDAETFEELLGELRGEPGRDPGAAARRQEDAAGDRRPQRRPGAGAAQDQARPAT